MLSFKSAKLIENDLVAWKAAGASGFPQFSPITVTAVDLDTGGKATQIINLATATPINWQQLLATLLPILIQLIPILVQILGGG